MSGEKRRYAAPSATPWDGVADDSMTPAETAVMLSHRSMYEYRHSAFSAEQEVAFFNGYVRERCSICDSARIGGCGTDGNGVRRWRCHGCGRTFTPMTGTIFQGHKLPVSDWCEFLLQTFSFESTNGMMRGNRRSETTLPYWVAKLFLVLDGIQDGVVLSGDAQIDEKYYPVARADELLNADGSRKRGLSRNKLCRAIGRDGEGRSVFVPCGRGKPSKARAWEACGSHIAEGSTLSHDKERSHAVPVDRLSLVSVEWDAREISRMPRSRSSRNCSTDLFLRSVTLPAT
jgi:transposase-like protein